MTVVPVLTQNIISPPAISLARYAQLIHYDECAVYGVQYENQANLACGIIWQEYERQNILQALAEAQQEIEQVVGYPTAPVWVVGDVADEPAHDARRVDSQPYTIRMMTRYSHVIEAGVRATSAIGAGESVDHASDPAVVGPVATTAADADEIRVYYPGSTREILPSQVTISGGNVTIRIPRCRMVKESLLDNAATGLDYTDTGNFTATVDVVRVYTDPSTQAVMRRPHCANNGCDGGCNECTQTACMYIRDKRLGIVDVLPATYSSGSWTKATPAGLGEYRLVRMNYRAGLQTLPLQLEMAILRLAHSKLAVDPCSCDVTINMWRGDREVPEVLTRERLNCPFGLSNGAYTAWKFVQQMQVVRAGVL